jgi:hypothetical protein
VARSKSQLRISDFVGAQAGSSPSILKEDLMTLLQYSPHVFAILIVWFFFEWVFYERKRKARMLGVFLRLGLLIIGAMVIVHFIVIVWNSQFEKHPPRRPPAIHEIIARDAARKSAFLVQKRVLGEKSITRMA